jgi:hypothetical protein
MDARMAAFHARVSRRLATGLLVASLLVSAGCEAFPQLQSLERTTSEPRRKKVREHAACLGESKTQSELVACMDARGYRFIAPAADQRAQSCLAMRGHEDELPEAFCFELKE